MLELVALCEAVRELPLDAASAADGAAAACVDAPSGAPPPAIAVELWDLVSRSKLPYSRADVEQSLARVHGLSYGERAPISLRGADAGGSTLHATPLPSGAAIGDVGDPASLLAARVHGRPLLWFFAPDASLQPNELDVDPRTELLGIWVLGASVAADLAAPADDGGTGRVVAFGVDTEAALLDNQWVKLIAFVDVNGLSLARPGGDGDTLGFGVHPGVRASFDVAGTRIDVDGAGHVGGDGYQPRVFDRLYVLERDRAFGADKPKLLLERPASFGWDVRAQVGFFEALTAFVEARDQAPVDPSRGASNLTTTLGASAWLLFAGATVTATQTDAARSALFGPGFVVTGEGRVALVLNVLHVVGRVWRAHVPAGAPGDYVVDEGTTLGLELNLDVL
jgi:hypothetical protein